MPIELLPKTALQALYHAVTGKTETYSKTLSKNVVITYHNFGQLYQRLKQQIDHYQLLVDPTVTVIVKNKDSKKLQYSSWERFQDFSINSSDMTSELILKLEFIIQLPNTVSPQRCIVNVSLDSGLPVVTTRWKEGPDLFMLEFLSFLSQDYRTVDISIDFVDFLVAKIFCGVVEEWFLTLDPVPRSKLTTFLLRKSDVIRSVIGQFGRLGGAAFLFGYIWFNGGTVESIGKLVYAASIALFMWSLIVILTTSVNKFAAKRLFCNIVPSVILLTDADTKAYDEIKRGLNSSRKTIGAVIGMGILNIGLNLVASYVYTFLTRF
jgi:hypothetical protein